LHSKSPALVERRHFEGFRPNPERTAAPACPNSTRQSELGQIGGQTETVEHLPFESSHLAHRRAHLAPKDRPGRADLEGLGARPFASEIIDPEESSTLLDAGEIPEFDAIVGVASLVEHSVEDLRLKCGDEKACRSTIPRRRPPFEEFPGLHCIVTRATESLFSVPVGHASSHQFDSALLDQLDLGFPLATQRDVEAISAQVTGLQFVSVSMGFEHLRALEFEVERLLRVDALEREPLSRDGMSILATGITHVARGHATLPREFARHLLGRAPALLDMEKQMLALARGRIEWFFDDDEVFGLRPNQIRAGRLFRRRHACTEECIDPRRSAASTGANERR